ncbi:hypothetical protein [Thaumasiovibrio sp. DFM-14]|uniref:hypothetical protein n=1 Tax=Thaumasiovibrio sp. DFM-14 TaxID=3384792 RepID=UPI00399F02EA
MQPQLPPGLDRLSQIPPQQLKSEQQQSQPAKTAVHVGTQQGQQQWPQLQMPLAQWQVVRMLYQPSSLTATRPEPPYSQATSAQQSSPALQLRGDGVLQLRVTIDGQVQQISWQIQHGEAVLLASTLNKPDDIQLLPSLNGGWRVVVNRGEVNEPVQLLWRLDHGNPITHQKGQLAARVWVGAFLALVLLLLLIV